MIVLLSASNRNATITAPMPVKRSFIDGARTGEEETDAKPRRKQTVDAWSSLADTVFVPYTGSRVSKADYIARPLVDEVGENESHPGHFAHGDCRRAN